MCGFKGFGRTPLIMICAVALGVAFVTIGSNANADDIPIPTKVGIHKYPDKLFKLVSKPPTNVDLPTCNEDGIPTGGGLIMVTQDAATRLTCALPAANWDNKATGGWKKLGKCDPPDKFKGYKYLNKGASDSDAAGPCKVVIVKGSVVKIVAKGDGTLLAPLDTGTPPMSIEMDIGDNTYCAEWDVWDKQKADKLVKAKGRPEPSTCGVPTTTTTSNTIVVTTTTTTTTLVSGCFKDIGDGTIHDTCTGLQWEKKDGVDTIPGQGSKDLGNLHDVDNRYTWAGECLTGGALCQPNADAEALCKAQTEPNHLGCERCSAGDQDCDTDWFGIGGNGSITTIWDWLDQVRDAAYGGESDWRLATSEGVAPYPTGEPAELESILNPTLGVCGGGSGPCIDPIFGPTATAFYWSASPSGSFFMDAWIADYETTGLMISIGMDDGDYVRAVRCDVAGTICP